MDKPLFTALLFSRLIFDEFKSFYFFETNLNLFVVRRALRGSIIPWQQMELFIAQFVLTSGERERMLLLSC